MSISHWHIIRNPKRKLTELKLTKTRTDQIIFKKKKLKNKIEPELNQNPNMYPNIKNIIYLPKIIFKI